LQGNCNKLVTKYDISAVYTSQYKPIVSQFEFFNFVNTAFVSVTRET